MAARRLLPQATLGWEGWAPEPPDGSWLQVAKGRRAQVCWRLPGGQGGECSEVEVRSKKESPRAAVPVETLGALGASVVQELSDESLLAGLGSGDPDAAADFVRRFQRRVFGLTFSILRDRAAAEEAAQESFVRAWRHASAFDPRRGTVVAWLLTIARNVSINMLPTRRFDPIDPEDLLALEAKRPHQDRTEAQVVDSELLREPLARLPRDQRRALVLAAFYGFTAREISELDGVPLGTVKTRIRSAMLKLRAQLRVSDDR
jgi:RNA polymerase sigma factor (sigma-70 family)